MQPCFAAKNDKLTWEGVGLQPTQHFMLLEGWAVVVARCYGGLEDDAAIKSKVVLVALPLHHQGSEPRSFVIGITNRSKTPS